MNRLTDDLFGGAPKLKTAPVLVPMPAPRAYSYSVPDDMAVEPGSIVQVPLGSRLVAGVVWDRLGEDDVDPKKLRPIAKVFDCPPLTKEMRAFVDWVSAYTLTPPGLVARMALRAPAAFDPEPMIEGLRFTGVRPERMTAARERVLALVDEGLPWTRSGLAHAAGTSSSVIDGLAAQGSFETIFLPPPPVVARPDPDYAAPRLEQPLRKLRKHQPEGCELAGLRYRQSRSFEGIGDRPFEVDRVLPDMGERGKHGSKIASVLVEHRRGDGKARLAKRRIAVGSEAVEEAPLQHRPAEGADLGIVPRIAEKGERRLRGQRLFRMLLHPPRLAAHHDARAGTLQDGDRAPPGLDRKLLGLDLRLECEPGGRRRPQPRLDPVSEGYGAFLVENLGLEPDANRLVRFPAPRPQHRRHAAFGCDLACKRPARGRLDELERAVEIGLSGTVLADEQVHLAEIHADRP